MQATGDIKLRVKLHGAPQVALDGTYGTKVTGARNVALIALLVRSGDLRCSRAALVDTLWTDSSEARARANLRQLLHALRQTLGEAFDAVFEVSRDHVALRPDRVEILGGPEIGLFLEGIDLPQEGFEEWLRGERQAEGDAPPRFAPLAPQSALTRIMVLPFAEIDEGGRTGIGDAVAGALTGCFARSQLVDAISHFSGRNCDVSTAGPSMCDALVTGSCRMADGILTVEATLSDVGTGRVIWSERVQGPSGAFLAGDDGMVREIAGQCLRHLMARSIAASSSRPLPDLRAHELLMAAVGLTHSFDRRHFQRAERQLAEVVERCPDVSWPRAWQAQWHLLRIYQKWSDDPALDSRRAGAAIRNALDLDPECPLSLAIDGNLLTVLKTDFVEAGKRFAAAQAINPSSALISQLASVLATFTGDGAAAVALTDRGWRLSPRDPRRPFFQTLSAGSYVAGGRHAEAVEMAEASLRQNPLHLSAHRCRVIALQLAGREAEARRAVRDLMRVDPGMTVSGYLRSHPAAETGAIIPWANALKEAGVPVN